MPRFSEAKGCLKRAKSSDLFASFFGLAPRRRFGGDRLMTSSMASEREHEMGDATKPSI